MSKEARNVTQLLSNLWRLNPKLIEAKKKNQMDNFGQLSGHKHSENKFSQYKIFDNNIN